MNESSNPPVVWVDSNAKFESLALSWQSCKLLAIDTEFERRTTYFPILALLQVFDGETIYLIDPLEVQCPVAFREICGDPNITKIMHSAREDLEVFYHSWGCQFVGLFDTQVAYAFLSGEISKGYAPLVAELCQQVIDKQATQSDWIARPLSSKQLDYAAKDVLFLPQIYTHLADRLTQKVFLHWFNAECKALCLQVTRVADYTQDYRLAKEVWRLDQKQLSLFKNLYQWREETAIREDRTKNHILRDSQLVEVAKYQPKNKAELRRISEIHPRSLRLYWQVIVEQVVAFEQATVENLNCVPNPRDIPALNPLSESLLIAVKSEAAKYAVVANLLASKRNIKKIAYAQITGEPFPELWNGWRGDIFKPLFKPIFSQFTASTPV